MTTKGFETDFKRPLCLNDPSTIGPALQAMFNQLSKEKAEEAQHAAIVLKYMVEGFPAIMADFKRNEVKAGDQVLACLNVWTTLLGLMTSSLSRSEDEIKQCTEAGMKAFIELFLKTIYANRQTEANNYGRDAQPVPDDSIDYSFFDELDDQRRH